MTPKSNEYICLVDSARSVHKAAKTKLRKSALGAKIRLIVVFAQAVQRLFASSQSEAVFAASKPIGVKLRTAHGTVFKMDTNGRTEANSTFREQRVSQAGKNSKRATQVARNKYEKSVN